MSSSHTMKVLKFGGSSVASPERIRTVAKIILAEAKQEPLAAVVSAGLLEYMNRPKLSLKLKPVYNEWRELLLHQQMRTE